MLKQGGGPPSEARPDPARAGELKAASPTLEAYYWLADAVLKSLRALGKRPSLEVAIGLPRRSRYERLFAEIDEPLHRLGVTVYLVEPDGAVAVHTSSGDPDTG